MISGGQRTRFKTLKKNVGANHSNNETQGREKERGLQIFLQVGDR
jgi:hypothetical protein